MAQFGNRREARVAWGKRVLLIAGALLAIAALVLGALGIYARVQDQQTPDAALSYSGLLDDLQTEGATVQEDGPGGTGGFLAGTAHFVTVNGSKITVYEYVTTHDAALDVTRISPDGSTITSSGAFGDESAAIIDYIAPPHWFHEGHVIVLYVGCDDALIALLQQVLGPPFAGDSEQFGC